MEGVIVYVGLDAERARALRSLALTDGLQLVAFDTARRGLNGCCALEPICIVAEMLPETSGGIWLVKALREQPGMIGSVPVVLLGAAEARNEALGAGADLLVPTPTRPGHLYRQVRALIEMAQRVSDRKAISSALRRADETAPSTSPPGPNLAGRLEKMPVPTILALMELERRSGTLSLSADGSEMPLRLELCGGALVGGALGAERLEGEVAVREALRRQSGQFEFLPGPDLPRPEAAPPLSNLLIAALTQREPPAAPEPAAPQAVAPPRPKPPQPPRSTTLMSHPAVRPPAPIRRQSQEIRAAIRVVDPPPLPIEREQPEAAPEEADDDVIEAHNERRR